MDEKERVNVGDVVMVHMITNGEHTKGWVHTHGMARFGLPELEVRGLPLFMMAAAGHLINEIADYMLNEKEVKLGENFGLGRFVVVQLAKLDPIPGDEEHFQDERWALIDPPGAEGACECCAQEGTA